MPLEPNATSLALPDAKELSGCKVAALVSSGIESAVMIAELARAVDTVYPLYFECGLHWENVEKQHLRSYVAELALPNVAPVQVLTLPSNDLYARHWSVTGIDVPDAESEDEAVFLPGRNLLLISKAAVFCFLNNVQAIALGSLMGNPFADASDSFMQSMEGAISTGLSRKIQIWRPFQNMHKPEVIRRGRDLPLHLSMSCIKAHLIDTEYGARFIHCGACNKCAERQKGFAQAAVPDATEYACLAASNLPR